MKCLTWRKESDVGIKAICQSHSQPCAALPESKARGLRALIAVMNDIGPAALRARHVERHKHQISAHLIADRPAHHAPTPDVQNDGQVDVADPGWHLGQVGHPELIRLSGGEPTLDQIGRRALRGISFSRHYKTTAPAHTANVSRPASSGQAACNLPACPARSARRGCWGCQRCRQKRRGSPGCARSAPHPRTLGTKVDVSATRRIYPPIP